MALRGGDLVTEPLASSSHTAPLSALSASLSPSSDEIQKLHKRQREQESTSPTSNTFQESHFAASPAKAARLALASRPSASPPPPPLTGAAALEDERRRRAEEQQQSQDPAPTSDNPSHTALAALMSASEQPMSRPTEAPVTAPTAAMDTSVTKNGAVSPRVDDLNAQDAASLADAGVTESPAPMEVDQKDDQIASQQVAVQDDRTQPGSLSYPGSLESNNNLETPVRGMSFPEPGQGHTSPTASGSKKHKCPYCNTEFTRHHNLKSHLLTHSQEKPFLCTECQMRFRRLHDLKRHGKLHTGEKPHVCPKCDRKFARGDALARHSKGAGGCAGRRSSMGSFADGDEMDSTLRDPDDSTMSGLTYDNPEEEEELRRQSLPSMNAPHMPSGQGDSYAPHARTYPPAQAPRSGGSGLYPPNATGTQTGGSSTTTGGTNSLASAHTPNTSVSSAPMSGGNAGMYSQTGMTESPKPLSPGVSGNDARQRSPGMTQQLQQQQFTRRQSDLQSPHGGRGATKLPVLSHPSSGFPTPGLSPYAHGRTPSNGGQAGTTGDSSNMFAQSDPSLWSYVQTLEATIKTLVDKVATLEAEMATVKGQLDDAVAPAVPGAAPAATTA